VYFDSLYYPIFQQLNVLAFSQVEVFKQFVKDVLEIEINIDKVHTEYEYPRPVGFVRSQYDLFAEDAEKRIIVEIQHLKQFEFVTCVSKPPRSYHRKLYFRQ